MAVHRVEVSPIPSWLDHARWLGPGDWVVVPSATSPAASPVARAELETAAAADLAARLRGVWLAGEPVVVECTPPLKRGPVRAARTEDARRRRATTPAFDRTGATADGLARAYLTPQSLALELAREIAEAIGQGTVVDAMCGAGGNAIALARQGLDVIAVDLDGERLAMARRNARLYGVEAKVEFIHGDGREVLQARTYAAAFLDPPWVLGEGEVAPKHPTAAELEPLAAMLDACPEVHIWIKLPAGTHLAGPLDPTAGWIVRAVFGQAPGDQRRIKFLVAGRSPATP